jgi:hypothetical protein
VIHFEANAPHAALPKFEDVNVQDPSAKPKKIFQSKSMSPLP